MKKSQKRLLKSLFVSPLHRFRYKSFTRGNDGISQFSDWEVVWTEGINIYEKGGTAETKDFRNITTSSLRTIVNVYLAKKKPGHELYTYHWEYTSSGLRLNLNHPWYREMKNAYRQR